MDVAVLKGLTTVDVGGPNMFAPVVNGFAEGAGAVESGWLNGPPGVLNLVVLKRLAAVIGVLLLPNIFAVVDAVEGGANQMNKKIKYIDELFE